MSQHGQTLQYPRQSCTSHTLFSRSTVTLCILLRGCLSIFALSYMFMKFVHFAGMQTMPYLFSHSTDFLYTVCIYVFCSSSLQVCFFLTTLSQLHGLLKETPLICKCNNSSERATSMIQWVKSCQVIIKAFGTKIN